MEKKTTKILIIISAIILAGGLITAALFLTKGTIITVELEVRKESFRTYGLI